MEYPLLNRSVISEFFSKVLSANSDIKNIGNSNFKESTETTSNISLCNHNHPSNPHAWDVQKIISTDSTSPTLLS